ncbi:conserved Plasmodium protein, unknown function [Plasmodium chabaudi adami]|uniref:Uncharacterized protein n=1 Tax=Plasmodium chabaudi adami TaxID=5826 RepID=A0A1D3LJV7_PLACE|nr:conserved Plasmodium protein, unknown function [Plasmodium chabaudi adami]
MNKNIHSKICELKQNNSQGELNIALNNLKAKNKNDKNGTILNDNKNKFQEKQSEHENDLYRILKINNELDGNLKNIENLEQKYFYLQNEKDKRKKKKKQFYKLGNSILNNLDPNNKSTFLDTCENKSEKKENPGSFYFSYNSYEKNSNNNSSQKNYTFENRNDEDYNSFKSSTKDIQNILNRNPDVKLENFNTRYNSFVNNKQKSAIYYMKNEEDNYTSNKDNISSENDEIDDDSYNKLLIPSFPKGIKDNVQTEKKIQNIKDKLHEINYKSQNLFNKIEEEYVQKFRNNGNYFNHEVDNYYTTDNNKNLFPNKFNENNCIFEQNIKDFPYQGYSGDISLNQKITQGKENYNDQYVISNYINQTNNEIEVITADGNKNNANLISLQKLKNNNFTKSNHTIYTKPNIYKNNKLYNSYNYINQNLEYMQNDVNNINTTNIHKIIRENIPPKSQDGPIINETPNFVSRIINGNTSTSLYDEKLANNNTNNINNALNSNADLKFHSKTGISNLHVKNCTNNMNRGNEQINNINKLIINYRNKEEAKENEKNVKKEIHISGINLPDGGNFSNPIASNMKWNNNSNLINSMTNVNDTNKEKYWIKKTYIDNTDIHNADTLTVPNNMNKLYDLKNEKPKKKNDLNINNKDTIMISGRYPENSPENNNRQIMKNDVKLAKNVFMNSENQIINSDTNKLGSDIIYHNNRQVNELYNKKLSYFDELENMDHEKNDSYANCNRNMKLKFDEIHSNDYPVFHDQNSRKKWEQSFNKYSNNLKEVNNHGKNLISNNSINATSANLKSFQQTNSINHENVKDYKRKYHNINYNDFKQNQLLDINDTKNLNLPNQYISKNFMATHIINEDENILGSTKMSSFDGITKLEDEKNTEYLTGEYSYINGTRGENKLYNNENTDCFRKYKDLINTNINNEKYNANGKYNKNNFFSSVNISDRANTKNITEIGKYQLYQKDYNLKTFKNKSVNPQSFLQIKNNTAEIQNNDYNFRHTNLYFNEVNHIDQEITKSKYENSNIPNKIYINDFLAQNYNETIEYHFNANNKIRNEIFISSHDQTIRTNVDTEQNDIVNNYNIEGKYNIRNIIKESTNTTICYIIQNILQYCNKIFNDLYVNNDLLKKKKRNELNLYLIKLRENNYEQFFFNLNKYFEALLAFLNSNYIYKCNSSILYNICIVVKNLFFLLNFGVYIFHIIKVCAHCIVKLILMNPISIIDKTWFFLLNLYRYIFQKLYEHFKIYFNNNENHPMDKESLEILVSFINTFNEIIIEYGKIRIIARNKKKEELIAFPLYEALKPFFFLNTAYYDNSPKMNEKNEVKFSTKILISSSDSSDCNNRSDSSNSNNYESYHSNKHSRGNSMEKTQEKIEHYMNIDNMYDQIVKRKQKNENKKENKNKFYNENSDFLDCKSQCSEKNRRENIFEYTNNASNEILDKQNKDHVIHSKNSIMDTKNYIKKNNDDELSIYMRNNLLCSMQTLIKMFSHIYINNWDKILYYYNENTNERIPIFLTIIINDHNQKLRTNSILCLKYLFDCKQLKYWFLLKTNIYNSDTNDFNNGQSALKDEESAISVSNMIVDQSKDNNSHSSFNNSNDNNKIKKNINPTNRGEYYQHSLNGTYAHEQGYALMAMVNDDIPLRKYASPKIETQIKYNYIDTQIQNIICPENLSDLKNIVNDNNSEGSGCIIDKKLDKETEKDIYICDKTIEEINSNNQESLEKQNEKNKIHKKGSTYTNMNKGNKNLDYSTQTHGEADYKNGNINYKKLMIEDNIIKMLSHLIKLINKTYLLNNENNFYTPIDRLNIYRFFLRVSQSMLLKKYKNLLMKILKTSFFYLLKYLIYFNNGDMLPFCGKKLVQNKSNLKNKKQHILHNNSDNELTFLNNGQSINKGDIKKNKKKSHTLSNNFLYIIDEHNSQNIRKTQSFIQNTSGTSTQVVENDHIDEEHMLKSLNNSSECFKQMGKYEEDSIYIIIDPEKSYPYHEKELKNNFKYLSYNSEHNDNAYGKKTINKIKNKDIEIDTKQFLQEDAKNETYINYKKEKANNKFKDNESMINTIDEKIKKKHLDIDKHKIDENVYKGNNLDVIENEKNIETHNGNTQCFRSFYDSVQHAKEFNDDKMICNLKDQKSDESICGIKREHIEEDIISIYSDKKTEKRRKNKNKDFFQIFQNEEMEPNTQMNTNENDISYLYKNINKINRKLLCKKNYELLIRVLYCNEYSKNSKYICTITVIINIFSVLLCEYNDDIYNFLCTNIYRKNINKILNNRNIFCENSTPNYLYNISFVQLIYFMLIFLYKIFYQTCDEEKNNLITNIGNPSTYNINDTFNNVIKEHLQNENNYNNKNGGMTNNNQFSTDSKYETGQKNGVINKDYSTNCDSKTIYNNTESCNNIEICSNKNNYLKDKKTFTNNSYTELFNKYITSYTQREFNKNKNVNIFDKYNLIPYDMQIFKNMFAVFQKTLKYYLFCYMHCWNDVKTLLEYFLQSENINIKIISIKIVIDIFTFINAYYEDKTIDNNNNNSDEPEFSVLKEKDNAKNSPIYTNEDASEQTNIDGSPEERKKVKKKNIKNDNLNDTAQPEEERKNYSDTINVLKSTKSDLYNFTNVKRESKQINKNSNNKKNGIHCGKRKQDEKMNKQRENNSNSKCQENYKNYQKKKFMQLVERDMIYLFRKYILMHIHSINKIDNDAINKRNKIKHVFFNTIICISQLSYEGFKVLKIEDIQKLTSLISSCANSIKCNIITTLSKYIIKYIFTFNKKFIQMYEKKINLLHINSANVYYNNILSTQNNFHITKNNFNIDILLDENSISSPSGSNIQTNESHKNETSRNNNYLSMLKTDQISDLKNLSFLNYSQNKQEKYYKMEQDIHENGLAAPFFVSPDSNEFFQKNNSSNHMLTLNNTLSDKSEECSQNMNKGSQHYSSDKPFFKNRQIEVDSCRNGNNDTNICNRIIHNRKQEIRNMKNKEQYFTDLNADNERKKETNDKDSFKNINTNKFIKFDNYQTASQKERDNNNDYFKNDKLKKMETNTKNYISKINIKNSNDILMSKKEHAKNLDNISHQYSDDIKNDDNIENENYYNNSKLPNSQINVKEDNNAFNDSIYILGKQKNEKKLFELYYIYIYIIIHIIKFYNESFVDLKYYIYNCICEIASSYIPFYFTQNNIKSFSYYSNHNSEENKDINEFISFINNINTSTNVNDLKLYNFNNKKKEKKLNSKKILKKTYNSDNENDHHTQTSKLEFIQSPNSATKAYEENEYSEIPGSSISTFIGTEKFSSNESGNERLYNLSNSKNEKIENNSCIEHQTNSKSICVDTQLKNLQNTRDNMHDDFSTNIYLISYIEYIYILLLIIRGNRKVEKDRAICCIIRYLGFICKNMNFFLFNSINLVSSSFLNKYFVYLNNLIEKNNFFDIQEEEISQIEGKKKKKINKNVEKNNREISIPENIHNEKLDSQSFKNCMKKCIDTQKELNYGEKNEDIKKITHDKDESINQYGEKIDNMDKKESVINSKDKLYHLFLNIYVKYEYDFDPWFISSNTNVKKERKIEINSKKSNYIQNSNDLLNNNEQSKQNSESKTRNVEDIIRTNPQLDIPSKEWAECYSYKKIKNIASNPIIIEIKDIFNSNINKNGILNNPNNIDSKIILYLLSVVKDHIKNKITWNVLYAFKLIYNNFSFFFAHNFTELHNKILDSLINILRFTNVYKIKILSSLALMHIPLYYDINKNKLKELWDTLISNIIFFDVTFSNDDKSNVNPACYYYNKGANYFTISKKNEYKYKCTLRINICELLYICIYRSYIHSNINTSIEINNEQINCYEIFKKYTHIFNINNDLHIYNLTHIFNNHVLYYSFYNNISKESEDSSNIPNIISNCDAPNHQPRKTQQDDGCNEKQTLQPEQSASNEDTFHEPKQKNKNIYNDETIEFQLFLNRHFDKYNCVYRNLLESNKNTIFLALFLKLHYEIKNSLKKIQKKRIYNKG